MTTNGPLQREKMNLTWSLLPILADRALAQEVVSAVCHLLDEWSSVVVMTNGNPHREKSPASCLLPPFLADHALAPEVVSAANGHLQREEMSSGSFPGAKTTDVYHHLEITSGKGPGRHREGTEKDATPQTDTHLQDILLPAALQHGPPSHPLEAMTSGSGVSERSRLCPGALENQGLLLTKDLLIKPLC